MRRVAAIVLLAVGLPALLAFGLGAEKRAGGGCIAPPGQRWFLPVWSPASREPAFGVRIGPVGVLLNWKALKSGWIRA